MKRGAWISTIVHLRGWQGGGYSFATHDGLHYTYRIADCSPDELRQVARDFEHVNAAGRAFAKWARMRATRIDRGLTAWPEIWQRKPAKRRRAA